MSVIDRAIALALPAVPKPVVGYFSRPYIAGSTADDAFRTVRALREEGVMATLDILGEFVTTPEEVETNAREYVALFEKIRAESLPDTNVSVKLSSLGLTLDRELCLRKMREVAAVADRLGNFVRIDMEDSSCTDATLAVYRALRSEFPRSVGVVLQSRLRRTLDDTDALTTEPANFRLCKGIYLEPRDIAFTDPELIRSNFTLVLERMIERGAYVGIATHDERLAWEGLRLVRKYSLARDRYEFQMLLGVDERLRRILIRAGHRLRVYVPFGEKWHAYSMRRLRENPQVAGYILKALFRK